MMIENTCLCGGHWDWVREDPQKDFSAKPNLIPFELDAPNKINGWVWTYICNQDCEKEVTNIEKSLENSSELFRNLFPGSGGSSSSSSSDDKKCSLCGAGRGSPHKRTICKFVWTRYVDPSGYE